MHLFTPKELYSSDTEKPLVWNGSENGVEIEEVKIVNKKNSYGCTRNEYEG